MRATEEMRRGGGEGEKREEGEGGGGGGETRGQGDGERGRWGEELFIYYLPIPNYQLTTIH